MLSRTINHTILVLTGALTLTLALPTTAAPITQNGKPLATIVVDAKASPQTKNTARTLQTYVQKISDAVLPIAATAGPGINIHLGETAFAKRLPKDKLDLDGFVLQGVDAKNYVIRGGSDWGVEYGVYELLERYYGVRWLAGTDLFTHVPRRATLDLPWEKVRQEPVFRARQFSPTDLFADYSAERYKSMPWSAFPMHSQWSRYNRLRPRIEFHHNLDNVFPVSEFGQTNPEFYPLINGERRVPKGKEDYIWQPNFSAPGIVDAAARQIEKHFAANSTADSFSLGINDSRNWDESPVSVARREALGGLADEYATWVNDVVAKVNQKYPEKTYGLLAYVEMRQPPKNVRYQPNVVPYITYELSRWSDAEAQQTIKNLTGQWLKAASQLGWYDYFYGSWYLLPRSFAHTQADALRWLSKNGVRNYYGEVYFNFGEGPKDWVQTKLLWNPEQDVDALIEDWCNHAVGKESTPALKAYYDLWEKYWTQDLPKQPWFNRISDYQAFDDMTYVLGVPQEYIDQSDKLMNEAVAKAQTPLQRQRAEKLREMWQFYRASIIACKGDEYWKQADLPAEDKAVQLLQRSLEAIEQTQNRLTLLSNMRHDALYGYPAFRLTQWEYTLGADWGTNSLWSLLPWVNRSQQVRAGLEGLANQPQSSQVPMRLLDTGQDVPLVSSASAVARQVLVAADGNVKQLLDDASFEGGLQPWLVEGAKFSADEKQSDERSLLATGEYVSLRQNIPYQVGNYYAAIHIYSKTPTQAKVKLSLRAINQFGRQRGGNLPGATFKINHGGWQTYIVPFNLRELLGVTDTMSLLYAVDVTGIEKDAAIYIDGAEVNFVGMPQ